MTLNVIILAGGSGKRLWPLSTQDRPKQFCNLIEEKSLLDQTIARYSELGKCFILTSQKYVASAKKSLCQNILVEKQSLDTAHCLVEILNHFKNKNDTFLIVPSDHYIEDAKPLIETIKSVKLNDTHMNLFAFEANLAHTNLGYIKIAKQGNQILDFKEKPKKHQAEQYVRQGYYHNSGVILTTRKALKSNIDKYAKQLLMNQNKYESCSKVLFEKSTNINVFKVNSPFLDLGTYKSLSKFLKDKHLNDEHNCNTLIHATNRKVKSFGLKDVIVIESKDGVLIFHKDYIEKIDQLLK